MICRNGGRGRRCFGVCFSSYWHQENVDDGHRLGRSVNCKVLASVQLPQSSVFLYVIQLNTSHIDIRELYVNFRLCRQSIHTGIEIEFHFDASIDEPLYLVLKACPHRATICCRFRQQSCLVWTGHNVAQLA